MSQPVEPPDTDEFFDGEESDIENIIQTARNYHNQIDTMKRWSREAYADLVAEARVLEATEEDPDAVEQVRTIARLALTVNDRIEEGDTQRVRQP